VVDMLARRLREAKDRLDRRHRSPRSNGPNLPAVFETAAQSTKTIPEGLTLVPGKVTTLRGELGRVLNYYNRVSNGALLAAAADLLGSTSVSTVGQGFPEGYYNAATNPGARLLSIGGICEDAMSGSFPAFLLTAAISG